LTCANSSSADATSSPAIDRGRSTQDRVWAAARGGRHAGQLRDLLDRLDQITATRSS